MHGEQYETVVRFAKAVKNRLPHAEVKAKSYKGHAAAHVFTGSSYYQDVVNIASNSGMKFKEKTGGNDATGEATYLFVPKE
jgi:hypothetical protein